MGPPPLRDWRNDPATERQLEYLTDLGATPAQMRNLTKERASELIESLQAGPPPVPAQAIRGYYPQAVLPYQPKSRLIYILLALFLGMLGIHNLYAGRTGAGLTQLLMMLFTSWLLFPILIVFVWVLIDIIAVTTDGAGRPFA